MTKRFGILLVDDDAAFLEGLTLLLSDEGYEVQTATSAEQALALLSQHPGVRAMVTDLAMPGMDGLALLKAVRSTRSDVVCLVLTGHSSIKTAVEAVKLGAFQYLAKPVDPDELLIQLERACDLLSAQDRHRELQDRSGDPDSFDVLVGQSPQIASLRAGITQLAEVDSTVFIRGETGTGKELVARLIHNGSSRSSRRLVIINCTAIPTELLESELFGHEKGSFTGAVAARAGRIEEAAGGTLLLDEIGDMPALLQPKLLRFLQDRLVRRVGSSQDRAVDVRILAATHRNLEKAIAEGTFRADLFHRLNTIPVFIPPLRDRLQDLPELCSFLLAKIARRLRRPIPGIEPEALELLAAYTFPGNIRELENLLERAAVLKSGTSIRPSDLRLLAEQRQEPAGSSIEGTAAPLENGMATLKKASENAERDLILRALQAWPNRSNQEIADRLGTNRRILELRMKQYGINKR